MNSLRAEPTQIALHGPVLASVAEFLLDLFEGRHQLMVYHFMWLWQDGEAKDQGCPSCSSFGDQVSKGHLRHLHRCDVRIPFASPLAEHRAVQAA